MSIRGLPAHLARDGEQIFSFACEIRVREWSLLEVEIKHAGSELRINKESVKDDGEKVPLYAVKGRYSGGGLAVAYNNFSKGHNKPEIACTEQQAVFTQLLTPARFNATHRKSQKTIPEVCSTFMNLVAKHSFSRSDAAADAESEFFG